MPTPVLSPYVARGRSSYRNRGSGDYLRLTSGLPASGSWTACGWMFVRPRASTFHYFLGLSSSLASAGNENALGRSGSNVSEMYSNVASAQFSTDWFGTSGARLFVVFGASGTGANQMFARVRRVTSLAFDESVTGQIASYTPAAFWIGNDSYDEWTDHSFWNVRLWGRALSAAEALRESFSSQPVARDGLIGWWPLEGNLDQLLCDYSGNGRHLTRAGTPRAEPFFLPASVLMPLVDDAAVNAAGGGVVSTDVAGRVRISGAAGSSKIGATDILARVAVRGAEAANKIGEGAGSGRIAVGASQASAKFGSVGATGLIAVRAASSYSVGGIPSTDISVALRIVGSSTAVKLGTSDQSVRLPVRSAAVGVKIGAGSAAARVAIRAGSSFAPPGVGSTDLSALLQIRASSTAMKLGATTVFGRVAVRFVQGAVIVHGSLATGRPTSTGTRRPRATGGTRPRNTQ